MKHITSTILGTVKVKPDLLHANGVYCNFKIGENNLFAEDDGQQQQVYIFNINKGLYRVDTQELKKVFRLRSLSAGMLRSLPLDYLLDSLRNCQPVYQCFSRDTLLEYEELEEITVTNGAIPIARKQGVIAGHCIFYQRLINVVLGCMGERIQLLDQGMYVTARDVYYASGCIEQPLLALEKTGLLKFTYAEDSCVVSLSKQYLTRFNTEISPVFFKKFLY